MKHTLNLVKNDARTITGSNLRNILLMTGLARVEDLTTESVADIEHNHILEKDMWRVNIIKEIIDMKQGDLDMPDGWTNGELEEILNYTCTS